MPSGANFVTSDEKTIGFRLWPLHCCIQHTLTKWANCPRKNQELLAILRAAFGAVTAGIYGAHCAPAEATGDNGRSQLHKTVEKIVTPV